MVKKLVIVESPAKAKKIASFLPNNFNVVASVGHVRDLPVPSELPANMKKGPFGKFAVNLDNNFEPYYAVLKGKKRTVKDIKKQLDEADELYLATDEDREGEAISWHLVEELKPKVPVKRMVFQEITEQAITQALKNTRDLNINLISAQETRRILDRLFGYELSPFLWRKIKRGLSAGRVQSAATRLIVDRERQRFQFTVAEFWDILVSFSKQDKITQPFTAKLAEVGKKPIATAKDFDSSGKLISGQGKVVYHLTKDIVTKLATDLKASKSPFEIVDKVSKNYTRKPSLPYTTSTLQQDASKRLSASVSSIMSAAQSLYENGFITYMRTDSATLSSQAINAARVYAKNKFGENNLPVNPRVYKTKSANAQEAHEAIRPAGEMFVEPDKLPSTVSDFEKKLYNLIFNRTISSQMNDVKGTTITYKIQKDNAVFISSGTTITDKGFLLIYGDIQDVNNLSVADNTNQKLPNLELADKFDEGQLEAKKHNTSPPARYTEASLIKELEELSIGRPSTYSSTISTLRKRGYINQVRNPLIPTWTAFAVISLLENQVPELLDYQFTASMEKGLDEIAAGKQDGKKYLANFYYNIGQKGLHNLVEKLNEVNAREVNTLELGDGIVLRHGRYGSFFEDSTKKMPDGVTPLRVSVPDDIPPSEVNLDLAKQLLSENQQLDRKLGKDPKSGYEIIIKKGKWGQYISEVIPDGLKVKPKTAGLFKNMDPDKITLPEALKLLTLPRVIGQHPKLKADIVALNGRFGPYIKAAGESRSLASEELIFSITLDEAIELIDSPKTRSRKTSALANLKIFGADPETGKIVSAKNGRFGLYITDGLTNVSVPKDKDIAKMTADEAYELLAIKRSKS
ncbi:MAG: type I DNA topoisomerase [Bifidobacteriaceae bacterium]|jgi:DNA topoisomerase-1|nr:type I DNA topoisomerase [Bifidobacteriaceae bacterium]